MAPSDDDESKERPANKRGIPEALRRALQSGAQALFTGDDQARGPLGDLRLPKEAMQFLMQQVERGRSDLSRVARQEMRRMTRTIDVRGELRRALLGMTLRIQADITFEEDGHHVRMKATSLAKKKPEPADAVPAAAASQMKADAEAVAPVQPPRAPAARRPSRPQK